MTGEHPKVYVRMRCGCGEPLVMDEPQSIRLNLGQWRIWKDTGKVQAQCRRCFAVHVIDPGAKTTSPGHAMVSTLLEAVG